MATASITHRIDNAEVRRLLTAPDGPVAVDLLRRCKRVEAAAKRNLRRPPRRIDTGRLLNSITTAIVRTARGLVGIVGTNLRYGRYVHDGTGIYGPKGTRIFPKRGRVLRWPVRGTSSVRRSRVPGRGAVTTRSQTPTRFAYARSVRGIPPNPYLRDALPEATRD